MLLPGCLAKVKQSNVNTTAICNRICKDPCKQAVQVKKFVCAKISPDPCKRGLTSTIYNLAHFLVLILSEFFSFPLSFLFLCPSSSLPFAPRVLSGRHSKKLGVNYGVKPGNGSLSNCRYNGPFITIFAPKTDRVFFHLLRRKTIDIQNEQLCGLICPSPVICFSKISGGL